MRGLDRRHLSAGMVWCSVKVALNPKHFHIRAKAEDGTIWLTHEKFRQALVPIKDVTNDVLLALCADLSADGVTQTVERSVRFADGWECLLTVQVLKDRS
jgi:uncharacterized protein (DUF849 family)